MAFVHEQMRGAWRAVMLAHRKQPRPMRKHRPSPSSSPELDCKTIKSLENVSDGL